MSITTASGYFRFLQIPPRSVQSVRWAGDRNLKEFYEYRTVHTVQQRSCCCKGEGGSAYIMHIAQLYKFYFGNWGKQFLLLCIYLVSGQWWDGGGGAGTSSSLFDETSSC